MAVPDSTNTDSASPLMALIAEHIHRHGPMPVHDYMQHCLTHPTYGYYTAQQPFGTDGDFITAPEITSLFGELLGVWALLQWQQMGQPNAWQFMECGPGRGLLMRDALRAMQRLCSDCLQTMQLCLVEVSPLLRMQQKEALSSYDITLNWQSSPMPLSPLPTIMLANEYLDALPIRQYVLTEQGWCERCVDLAEDAQDFCFVAGRAATPPFRLPEATIGDVVEYCPEAHALMQHCALHAASHPFYALCIDYGYGNHGWGESLQAVRRHQPCDALEQPGLCDLTAHVDFARLADTASLHGAAIHGPISQSVFLQRLGIRERTEQLCEMATPRQKQLLRASTHRLIAPEEMGQLFQVMAISSSSLPPPAGFERR